MDFKDLAINDVFVKEGQNAQYIKVPEVRITCCKVKVNAVRKTNNEEVVFKPLDKVTKIEE